MSKKESWKNFGKNTGGAFKNFGKAIATTAKVALGNEKNEVDENGRSTLRNAWSKTGKGFGDAGKSLGKAASDTVHFEEKKDKKEEKPNEEAIDIESKDKE